MANDKPEFKDLAVGAGKVAADIISKAKDAVVRSLDQNDDGELKKDDITLMAERIKEKKELAKLELEKKVLSPIFEDDLEKPEFLMPKMIRIAAADKKHAESAACQGSIGYEVETKNMRVLNVYPDRAASFGIRFYPDMDSEIYYIDPADRDMYIALEDYYSYMKIARIGELQKIAQDLGAKHFRVTFKEQKKTFSAKAVKAKASAQVKLKGKGSAEASFDSSDENFSKVEIAADMSFPGHDPVEPTLKYYKRDPQIQSLISLRMSENAMTHQFYTLELGNSSGIKKNDAAKIDAALTALKLNGNATFSSEVESENRRIFEYEIDF